MFGNFTFCQKKVNSGDTPELESDLSPKDVPTDWSSPQAVHLPATPVARPTFSTSNQNHNHESDHGSEQMETLVQKMSRQTLLSYHRSDGSLRGVPQVEDSETGWSLPMGGSTFSVPIPASLPSLAATNEKEYRDILPYKLVVDSTPLPSLASRAVPYKRDGSTSRLQYELPPPSDAPSPRAVREALMEKMIKHGVQCRVQPSMPDQTHAPKANMDQPMLDANIPTEELVPIEAGGLGGDDKNVSISLREAGMPSRIRYRRAGGNFTCLSAAEIASKNKNLKRSAVRMRRRPSDKPKPIGPVQLPTPPPEQDAINLSAV
ncbi:hypothetical protein BKA67DRAFT_534371 [Truncatella angustata]|uniref:Uncharacterized protein n=1 Tax=Truncatella angustata TaxID=152316 RepID=A0A9P8ZXY8_9PEZI|nr:uncharacterized protein BKA67DRAFT_534371 [Truncatella angustata]KAH6655446.1 hypothetical protein BKA67DRAFT_534371 [Truncatella angustata]